MQTSMNDGAADKGGATRADLTAKAHAAASALDADIRAGLAKLRVGDGGDAEKKTAGDTAGEVLAKDLAQEPVAEKKPDQVGEADAEKKPEEVQLDAATKKRLEGEQHRERKHREQVAADKAEIEAVRKHLETEWKPRVEKAEAYEKLKGTGVRGLAQAIEHLELTPEDLDAAWRHVYAMSPAGQKDPKAKAFAAGTMRDREVDARLKAAEAAAKAAQERAAAAEKKWEDRERAQQDRAAVEQYLGGVEKAAAGAADAPLVQKLMAKSPARAREQFHSIAAELADAAGAPSAAEVIAEVEKRLRADLEERGFDTASLLAPAAPAGARQPKAAPAGKAPAVTLGNAGGGAITPPEKPKTGKELDAQIIEDLRRRRASGSVTS